jgi:hypothetical protein
MPYHSSNSRGIGKGSPFSVSVFPPPRPGWRESAPAERYTTRAEFAKAHLATISRGPTERHTAGSAVMARVVGEEAAGWREDLLPIVARIVGGHGSGLARSGCVEARSPLAPSAASTSDRRPGERLRPPPFIDALRAGHRERRLAAT